MAASFLSTPELELSHAEAKAIAEAIAEVNKHYKIPGIRDDHAAVISLVIVLALTYGKRIPLVARARRPVPAASGAKQDPPPAPLAAEQSLINPTISDPWWASDNTSAN